MTENTVASLVIPADQQREIYNGDVRGAFRNITEPVHLAYVVAVVVGFLFIVVASAQGIGEPTRLSDRRRDWPRSV